MIFWSIFCSDPTFDYECLVLQCFDCILKQFSIVYVLLALWLYGVTTVFTYQGGAWNVTFKLSFLPGFRSYLNLFRISYRSKAFFIRHMQCQLSIPKGNSKNQPSWFFGLQFTFVVLYRAECFSFSFFLWQGSSIILKQQERKLLKLLVSVIFPRAAALLLTGRYDSFVVSLICQIFHRS